MECMLTREEMDIFDQSIRDAIAAQQDLLGLSDEKVGKMAFGFMPFPRMKMQAIKRGQGRAGSRKPQNLRFADVMNICESLGLSWQEVGREALKAVKKMEN